MTDLPRRPLGRTGLEVTTLGYGAMELRSGVSDPDAARILNAVLDSGINFIDTSIDYGQSEGLIGRHIANRRNEYFLASKCGCVPRGGVARGAPTDWQNRRYYMVTSDDLQHRWDDARLDDLLDGMFRMEFMLRFTLSDPNLDTTIVGTKNPDHLQENLEAAGKVPL